MSKFLDSLGLTTLKNWIATKLAGKVNTTDVATSSDYGIVKLNPNESIDLNASGQLTVGGRIGQFPNGGGLYYPTTIDPENVQANSFLISEATETAVTSNRIFALAGGANITCNSAAKGATQYIVNNTFGNRFLCACAIGGYATLEQATAGTIIAKVLSVKHQNGDDCVPTSGATDNTNKIVITLDKTINPDVATTKIRVYGSMTSDSSFFAGQGVGTGGSSGKGKNLELGQGICNKEANSILVGNSHYSDGTRSALFGGSQINRKQEVLLAGMGHDTTNGAHGVAAVGRYSDIQANTALAVGDGTSATARSNIFEVTNDSGATGLVLKSPNGSKFKVTVDDTGQLTATALT